MKTADEILHEHGIAPPPPGKQRYYTTCPQCSANRSRAHQKAACLGVTVKGDGVTWGCNHCLWTGGGYYNGKINGPGGEPARTYDYLDEQGNLLFQKVRNPPGNAQRFWQRRPDGKSGWINNTQGVRKVLYRLPEVLEAIASERTILVVEGEKDADSLWRIGIPATCSPDGASDIGKAAKWRMAYSESLGGADIVVIPDHDAAGYAHADAAAKASLGTAQRVRMFTLAKHWPDCPKGGDISDWLATGHTGEELAKLIEAAPDYVPEPAPLDDDAELERLAKMSVLDYDHARKAAAKRLDVRASILDKLMQAKRAELGLDADDGKQGHAIEFPTPEPWPNPVNGAELLDETAKAIGSHVIMPEHSRDACALWAAHTFLTDCTMISPRLAFSSPTKGCGKTTALDVMGQLVLRPLAAANVSPSAIFRVVEACHPTLLIDEADSFLKDNEELRGVLNSGHRRGGAVLRTVAVGDDFEVRSFSTYGAMVIALIGQLPGTLADRSVSIVLTRRKRSESVTPFRLDRVEHLVVLARKLARWAQDNAEAIAAVEPEMPAGLYNRAADNWRILLAIATAAGGDWLARGHKAALAGAGADVDEVSRLELLLGDTRNVFDELTSDTDRISSAHLIEKLCEIVPRPWGEYGKSGKPLTQNKLARLLKPLGIVPQKVRIGTETPNGYFRHQFVEAWERFLSLEGEFKPEHRNKCDEMGTSDVFQSGTAETDVPVRKSQKSNNDGLCSDVPVGEGGLGGESAKQSPSFVPVTFLGIEPFAPCAHCGKTGGVVHHVRDNRNLARPSVPLHEDCVADWFAAAEPAPPAGDGSMGLSVRTIRELAGEYQERLYSQYQGRGSTDVDSRPLDAWLRQRLAALGVFREHIDAELARVMDVVFAI